MKTRTLTLVLMLCLSVSSALYAQKERPPLGNEYPFLIRIEGEAKAVAPPNLFQELFDMGTHDELRMVKQERDHLGFIHNIYQQYHKGLKVEGACYKVHSDQEGVQLFSGYYHDIFQEVDIQPGITEMTALAAALNHVGAQKYEHTDTGERPESELVILADPRGVKPPHLAYKFNIYATAPLYRAYVFVDAHTGAFLTEHPLIHHSDVSASGSSLYNGNVSFTADFTGSNYRLRQKAHGGGIETYDMRNGTSYSNARDIVNSSSTFTNDPAAVQAHWGAEQTYRYFLEKHGRNSFDGSGATIRSYVHYANNYVNAFWDGARMTYGDGDGENYGPLVSLDIVAHEIAHGVTQFSADLIYQNESGALNESFSDIFGEVIENFASGSNDWLLGTEIGIRSSGAFRSLKNPNAYGDPDTYQGQFWHNGSGDNGGVHINSGVQNKWFYVLSEGESGVNDLGNAYNVTGIGMEKAAAIAYRNLSVYLGPSSNYYDARLGAIQAAADLYGAGSPEEIAVTNAWYAVGVGAEYGATSYCISAGQNAQFEWISEVTIGDFTHASANSGYSDFTAQKISLFPGNSYPISLTPEFSGQTYNEYWKIWIDLNIDGDFEDAGELVFDSGRLSSTTVTGTLDIPASAYGETRMRISMKWNAEQQSSCEVFGYGEVEDYSVSFSISNDTEAPSPPPNLRASNITENSVRLDWSASSDNARVVLYKLYINGNPYGSTNTRSFTVTNLDPGVTYTMSLTAEDQAGNESTPSTIQVTTLGSSDTEPPSPPSVLSAFNTRATSTQLSWSAATDNTGVTDYRIYLNGALYASTGSRNFTITGLTPNTTYTIGVTALDAAGNESSPRNTSVTTLPEADTQPPSRPENLTAGNTTATSTQLSWSAATDNVGVEKYEIFQGNAFLGATLSTIYFVNGLNPGQSYTFFVRAVDAAGNASTFNFITVVTTDDNSDTEPPGKPANLEAYDITTTTATLSWTTAEDNVGVVSYEVYEGAFGGAPTLIGSASILSFTITNLSPNKNYIFYVRAVDAAGNRSGYSGISVTTLNQEDTQPPSSPQSLLAFNTTSSSTQLAWTAASDNTGVTNYRIYELSDQISVLLGSTSGRNFTVTGLAPSTTHTFLVTARDAAGNESFPASVTVTTAGETDNAPPSSPADLIVSDLSATSALVSWQEASDNVGVAAYRVYINGNLLESTTGLFYNLQGLSPSTSYEVKVTAVDAAGNESAPASAIFTTSNEPRQSPGVLSAHYFEDGWDGWMDGGEDCYRYQGIFSWEGRYSIRLRDNSGEASAMTSMPMDLTNLEQVELELAFYARSMEPGESFLVQFFDGGAWHLLARYTSEEDFINGNFYGLSLTISRNDVPFAANSRFRIQCDASADSDQIYIDGVVIRSVSSQSLQSDRPSKKTPLNLLGPLQATELDLQSESKPMAGLDLSGIELYPNPARESIKVKWKGKAEQLHILDASGRLLKSIAAPESGLLIDLNDLNRGIYFLQIQTTAEILNERFIKQK